MFRLEIKHALRMFITKTMAEIKKSFQDSVTNTVQDYYNLEIDDANNNKVESLAGERGLEESQELEGSIAFQIRIIQDENQIQIHGYSRHDWDQPTFNKEQDRKWGLIRIPVLTQASKTPLEEKFLQRKIDIFVNISYLEKSLHFGREPKIYGKLRIVKTIEGTISSWEDIKWLENEVSERLKKKSLLTIQSREEKRREEAEAREQEAEAREEQAIAKEAETKRDKEYWQNKAEQTEKILADISRRELPYIRHEDDLMGLIQQNDKEQNIQRKPRVLEPVLRVVSVDEQNILEEANKLTKLKLAISQGATTSMNNDKFNISKNRVKVKKENKI